MKKLIKPGPGWRPGRAGTFPTDLDIRGVRSPAKPKKSVKKKKGK